MTASSWLGCSSGVCIYCVGSVGEVQGFVFSQWLALLERSCLKDNCWLCALTSSSASCKQGSPKMPLWIISSSRGNMNALIRIVCEWANRDGLAARVQAVFSSFLFSTLLTPKGGGESEAEDISSNKAKLCLWIAHMPWISKAWPWKWEGEREREREVELWS